MKFQTRHTLYHHYDWDNPFELFSNWIVAENIRNEDILYWDGVEQLQVPFVWSYDSNYYRYFSEFENLLEIRNINIFAIGGDYHEAKIPQGKRINAFRWKTALLHFIEHSISTQYNRSNVRIEPKFTKLFNCLNRHPREERIAVVDNLYKYGLFDYGDVSWNMRIHEWAQIPVRQFEYWKEETKTIDIVERHDSGGHFSESGPTPDQEQTFKDGNFIIRDYHLLTDYVLNNGCLFNITTESIPNAKKDSFFITEKTWKPILLGQPTIVLGNYWYKKHMEDMGFKFYDNIINYDFYGEDGDEDYNISAEKLCIELSKFKDENYQELYKQIEPIVEHNRQLAYTILNNDPYIPNEFINFYYKHKSDWDRHGLLKVDVDMHKIMKNKI